MSSRRTIVLTSLAAIALVCSGIVVQGFRPGAEGSDLEIFARYASQMLDGRIPYRDFSVEYPPGALAPMIVPYFGHPSLDAYAVRFGILIVVLLAATAVACATIVRTTHGSNERLVRSVLVIAFSPLLLGAFVLKRFDALPSLLTVVSLLLVVRGRHRASSFTLGVATAVKLYPIVLVPGVVAAAARRSRRDAWTAVGSFVVGCGVIVLPFLVLAPEGMWSSVHSQLGRHLQFESTLASVALFGHAVAGFGVGFFPEAHTYALGGARGNAFGVATTVITIGGLAAVWLRSTRAAQSAEGLVLFYAAAIAIVVAFGHVLSPQYLIWLIPLVPLVRGDLGRLVTALLVGACILTNLWFPKYFVRAIQTLDSGSILLLTARNALLVAIAVLLARAVWRLPQDGSARAASASERR